MDCVFFGCSYLTIEDRGEEGRERGGRRGPRNQAIWCLGGHTKVVFLKP
jgi:hypothetical protein